MTQILHEYKTIKVPFYERSKVQYIIDNHIQDGFALVNVWNMSGNTYITFTRLRDLAEKIQSELDRLKQKYEGPENFHCNH